MKRRLIIAGGVLLLAGIIAASIFGNGHATGETVYVEPVKGRKIEAVVSAPGEIDPKVKVNISAHVVGKIERLYFVEGERVKKGQKLVELEKQVFVAQRDRMRSEVAGRRIEVARARAALGTAELQYHRAVNMLKQGIQAQELYDKARLDLDNAKAGYDSAVESVRLSDAGLTQAQTDLDRTTIISPIDGRVVQLNAHEGEVVVTGTMNNAASVIAVIADLSEILVEAEVGETEVVAIKRDQKAHVHVDAVPGHEYSGHVEEIGSSAAVRQSGAGNVRYFKVKVAIDDADERLRPGMTSQVSIITSSAGDAVSVPIQSVVERTPPSPAKAAKNATADDSDPDNAPKKKYVFVVENDKVRMAEVQTGISDATHVVIASGLKSGVKIVTGPFRTLKKLHDGDAVQIGKPEKTATSSTEGGS
ncbi:MAG TPA: efflux RND transporter periplasmic adaptor subunit [Thermoanaerobaculia bacterium]|nr:efflux RND transporter periplasmic adaptor subunit [Thermoanaerobaculia bacterium]